MKCKRFQIVFVAIAIAVLALVLWFGDDRWRGRVIAALDAAVACNDCSLGERAFEAGYALAFAPALPEIGPTIIGGSETKEGEFPTIGALLYDGVVICTGTLIRKDIVLTAAHCGLDKSGKQLSKKLLAFSVRRVAIMGPSYKAIEIMPPPAPLAYDPKTHENDILLVQIDPTPATTFYQLPDLVGDRLKGNVELVFIGYGKTRVKGRLVGAGKKRKVTIPIEDPGPKTFVYRSKKNTCWGDSGGPALLGDRIVGVTSTGDRYCNNYGIDTRVLPHVPWLDDYV
jgi:hypothetical protein